MKTIVDLACEIQELLADDDQVTIRRKCFRIERLPTEEVQRLEAYMKSKNIISIMENLKGGTE